MGLSRRVALLCLATFIFLASVHPVAGAPVRAGHVTFEAAEATWLVKRHGDVYIYYVLAYRIDRPAGASKTRLFVDRSKCRLKGAKRKKLASCTLGGRVQKLERGDLRIDPLLNGARVSFGDHRVVWERPEAPEPDVDPFIDTGAAFADAYLERLSDARGRLYGTRLPKRGLDHAVLSSGIDVSVKLRPDELPPRLRFEVRARIAT